MTVAERIQKYKANDIDNNTAHLFELVQLHRKGGTIEDFIQFQIDWYASPQETHQEPGAAWPRRVECPCPTSPFTYFGFAEAALDTFPFA